MRLPKREITVFQKKIFTWWRKNKRDLPWRHTHDPYRILVSEVMLQQTQVLRVLPIYQAFLATFPTMIDLASASTADVLRAWKGMGYNRRAVYLKKPQKQSYDVTMANFLRKNNHFANYQASVLIQLRRFKFLHTREMSRW